MAKTPKNRGGKANARMTQLVLATYGDRCHICGRPGADTKDHLVPYSAGGTDAMDNYRPAHRSCNSRRGNRAMAGYGARVVVVTGPPASGKTAHVIAHADASDVVIDLDAITRALMPTPADQTHVYPAHLSHVAMGARKAAIQRATRLRERVTVWLIHALPSATDVANYAGYRWTIEVVDPGRPTVEARCRAERPPASRQLVARWYDVTRHYVPGAMPTAEAEAAGTLAPSRDW